MLKTFTVIILSVFFSVAAILLLLPVLGRNESKGPEDTTRILQKKLKQQQQRVWEQVVADIEKYGPDIYRMFCEISQNKNQIPGSNFGADKSFRKLEVSYPDSRVYKLASAWISYRAVMVHDVIRIEKIISELPADPPHQLMPNGFELEPVLYAAMFNYLQHAGKFEEAEKNLSVLREKYADSLLFLPEGNFVSVADWCVQQNKISSAIEKYQKRKVQ